MNIEEQETINRTEELRGEYLKYNGTISEVEYLLHIVADLQLRIEQLEKNK